MTCHDRRAAMVRSQALIGFVFLFIGLCVPGEGGATELFRFFVPMSSAAPPEHPGVVCEAQIELMGLFDGTTYKVYALDAIGDGPVASGAVDRFETATLTPVSVLPGRAYQLETSQMALAYMGEDCLDEEVGGSFFYPTSDGRSFIGKRFEMNIPVLSENNEFVVFAYEDADVTIEDQNGTRVASASMLADAYWEPSGLSPRTFYRIESSGRIALQSSARGGYTTVPGEHETNVTSCYNDAATRFLFATPDGQEENLLVVFAHEDASLLLKDLTNPQDKGERAELLKGEVWNHKIAGAVPGYWLLETDKKKRVSVSIGVEVKDGASSYLGDDISFSSGNKAYQFYLQSQSQSGYLFAFERGTTVDVIDALAKKTTYTLEATDYLELSPGDDRLVDSSLPVAMEVIAGTPNKQGYELIDFGSFVPPRFVFDADDNGIGDHEEDRDRDGNPDACDLDDDGDGVVDEKDDCPKVPADKDQDPDGDGCPETAGEGDRDGDGIADADDHCPGDAEDFDGDHDEDGCPETAGDSDGDNVGDDLDNCPNRYNPSQTDGDGDGVGDACDDDAGSSPQVGATGTGVIFSCNFVPLAARDPLRGSATGLLRLIWSMLP